MKGTYVSSLKLNTSDDADVLPTMGVCDDNIFLS
jgi:hypothetical protein